MTEKNDPKRAELPAELSTLDDDALAELLTTLTAEFDKMVDEGSRDVAALTALADDIDRVRGEGLAREAAAAQADADVAALAERVRGPQAEETPEEPLPEPGEEPPPEPEPEPAPEEAKKELVTAAAPPARPLPPRPPLGDVARRVPKPKVDPKKSSVTITAAVDLPGISPGAKIDLNQVALSMHDRARNLSMGQRAPVARIEVPHTHWLGTDPQANVRTLEDLIGQPQAPALVASGGWCAPSVPIFELFDLGPDTGNVFDLPSVGGDVRAGVMIPSFYGIGDVGGALWTWTEAMDMDVNNVVTNKALTSNVATITTADNHNLSPGSTVTVAGVGAPFDGTWVVASTPSGTTYTYAVTAANVTSAASTGSSQSRKGCLKIPCPTWTECRMEAEGLCVTHGNLSDRAWPELTRQFLSIVMGAHVRRMSAAKIAKVLATATSVTPDATMLLSDVAGDLLNVIELAAVDTRSQYRLAPSRSVDVLLPTWALSALRNNMAARHGQSEMNVSDSEITGWLSSRGVRVQFTPDWQPLYTTTPATRWPANVTFATWISGAYISIDGGTIDLGVTRDSTLNATNDFTAAWSEQFYQVCRQGPLARQYTVPVLVDGKTACCP